jgi:hypothetical protein
VGVVSGRNTLRPGLGARADEVDPALGLGRALGDVGAAPGPPGAHPDDASTSIAMVEAMRTRISQGRPTR